MVKTYRKSSISTKYMLVMFTETSQKFCNTAATFCLKRAQKYCMEIF